MMMKKKQAKKDRSKQPATQADLDVWGGELTRRLDRMEKTMTTKDELKQELGTYATKGDLKSVETSLRAEISKSEKRIIFEFKALAENIHHDVAGANKDEISAMKDTDTQLDERVTVLEKHVLHR